MPAEQAVVELGVAAGEEAGEEGGEEGALARPLEQLLSADEVEEQRPT